MKRMIAPNGQLILGTLENIAGRAEVTGWTINADGKLEPDYEGSTEVFWDGQVTVMQKADDGTETMVVLDEEGNEYRACDCTLVDETDPDEEADDTHQFTIADTPVVWRVWGPGSEAVTELDEASTEHITRLIRDGFREGELSIASDDETVRGYWRRA